MALPKEQGDFPWALLPFSRRVCQKMPLSSSVFVKYTIKQLKFTDYCY